MTVLVISIVATWIIFSTSLVAIICINSSRLSRIDEPFKITDAGRAALREEQHE